MTVPWADFSVSNAKLATPGPAAVQAYTAEAWLWGAGGGGKMSSNLVEAGLLLDTVTHGTKDPRKEEREWAAPGSMRQVCVDCRLKGPRHTEL